MLCDGQYMQWLTAQPWFRERHSNLYVLVTQGPIDRDAPTPEHNALQARFAEQLYCRRVWRAVERVPPKLPVPSPYASWQDAAAAISAEVRRLSCPDCDVWPADLAVLRQALVAAETAEADLRQMPPGADWSEFSVRRQAVCEAFRQADRAFNCARNAHVRHLDGIAVKCLEQACAHLEIDVLAEFEVHGWDVVLATHTAIELKPTIGDEYPAVVRTVRKRRDSPLGSRQRTVIAFDRWVSAMPLETVRSMFSELVWLDLASLEP